MPIAYNESTGEARMLTPDGQWAPTKLAENPDTGERLAFDGQQWKSVYKPGLIAQGARAVKNFVTGDNRREFDLPELMDALPAAAPGLPSFLGGKPSGEDFTNEQDTLNRAYALGPNDKAIGDIAVKTLATKDPSVAQKADKFGNPIISFRGKDYYVNRPGLSGADLPEAAGQVAAFTPAGRLGAAFRGIAGPLIGAAGAAVTSLGQDALSQATGSEQPVDLQRAGFAAAGGAMDRLTGPLVDRVANFLRQRFPSNDIIDHATGQLTERARAALREIGADPDAITSDMAQQFAQRAGQFPTEPATAAAVSEAQGLPVPVRLTQGQATGDPSQQMFENLSEKGAYGAGPRDVMSGARAQQREAIQGNVQAIQQDLGGGQAQVAQPGQGAQRVQQELAGARETARQGVDAAYKAARSTTAAAVPSGDLQGATQGLVSQLSNKYLLQALPSTKALLDDLVSTGKGLPNASGVVDGVGPAEAGGDSSVLVRSLFDWRQKARALQKVGGAEAGAIGDAVKGVDDYLDSALGSALVQGNDKAIEAFRTAVRTNREFASRFKGGDLIDTLTAQEMRGGQRVLSVPPDKAANVIFGANKLFGGTNTARDLLRMREELGPDSSGWRQLREEAWMRLVRTGEGQISPTSGTPAFSGAKFARAIDGAMTNDRTIMRTLFTDDELALMQRFKRVTARATGVVKGGDNFSNTTVALSNMVQNLMGRIFTSESGAQRMLAIPFVRSLFQAGMGLRAVAAQTPRAVLQGAPVAIGAPLAAGAAAAAGGG